MPTIANLAEWGKGEFAAHGAVAEQPVGRVGTDSRVLGKGDIFVALTTERDDGHRYVESALNKGVSAAIVAREKAPEFLAEFSERLIVVEQPLVALQRMAAEYRRILDIPVIGITGSNGKTSTRKMIGTVLAKRFRLGHTVSNFNNHIGVPTTLLSFKGAEEIGIIEMGANHLGEIEVLSEIALPDYAIITNVGYAHVGEFGSLKNTVEAKWEITSGLKPGGTVLLNGDDARLKKKAAETETEAVFFGFSTRCDIRAVDVHLDKNLHMHFTVDGTRFEISVPARHMIYNALPAIALGKHFGMDAADIADALKGFEPAAMRGVIEKRNGVQFIVDCYNANPSSMTGALQMLRDVAGEGRAVAVLGDMFELGSMSRRLHRQLGNRVGKMGVDALVTVGKWAEEMAQSAQESGLRKDVIATAATSDEAIEKTRAMVRPGDTVLLKGSRGVHLETVYERF